MLATLPDGSEVLRDHCECICASHMKLTKRVLRIDGHVWSVFTIFLTLLKLAIPYVHLLL